MREYIEITINDLLKKEDIHFLLVTATELETKTLHNYLSHYGSYEGLVKSNKDKNTYYIGKLGEHNIVHVQCTDMGSVGSGSSLITVSNALNHWSSIKVVLMIGICFGIDEEKQNIGDVLVSDSIFPYENRRVSKNDQTPRGTQITANKTLSNHFKSLKTNWNYVTDEGLTIKLEVCPLLSGEKLVDNKEYRDQLKKEFPTALGGEMEGTGLGIICQDKNIPWVLVKSICDFADGNKSQNKKKNQEIAAKTAIYCCIQALSSKTAFESLGVNLLTNTSFISVPIDISRQRRDVLFEIYDPSKEAYYLTREVDNLISNTLDYCGIWIYGNSGVGKTNALLRALQLNKKDFHLINLASCIDISINGFFEEIYLELANRFNIPYKGKLDSTNNYIRAIVDVISKANPNKQDYYLFLEEIPIEDNDEYKEFVTKFFALVLSNAFVFNGFNVKFVLSSIESPKSFTKATHKKSFQAVFPLEMQEWSNEEIMNLINLINEESVLNLEDNIKHLIMEQTNHSPRILKAFFRNAFIRGIDSFDGESIKAIASQTRSQF